jgi:hypothetical protein
MTAKVKPKSNGAVTLNVKPNLGALRALVKTMKRMQALKDMSTPDFDEMDAALDMFVGWMDKYAGVKESELEELSLEQMYDLLGHASAAFGEVSIPQTKSAP